MGGERLRLRLRLTSRVENSGSKTHDEPSSLSMGTPLLQQITLRDNGVLERLSKLLTNWVLN